MENPYYFIQKMCFFVLLLGKKLCYNMLVCCKTILKKIKDVLNLKLRHDAVKLIESICDRYKNEPTPLMLVLSDIQKEYGYIPLEVQEIVSAKLGMPVSEIYGVVTFYSFFSLTPKGKYVIGVCLGTACYVKGGQNVLDKFANLLNIKSGETTEDGLFTLDSLRCIGACGIAPAVSINGKVYSKVTVDEVARIIDSYRKEAAL